MTKMRVFILTCMDRGYTTDCFPRLINCPQIEVVGVVRAIGSGASRWRSLKRRLLKIMKIGVLGALNGIRMRAWYQSENTDTPDIRQLCQEYHVPFYTITGLNSPEMIELVSEFKADLGISLGNGYISPRVFNLPRNGMINLHSEILPQYQNAQSIIWPIYCRDTNTGFTIHRIARKIDAGDILYQKKIPLQFCRTLEQTVRTNKMHVDQLIPEAMAEVCANFEIYVKKSIPQMHGNSYTTPSIVQFLRMVVNNKYLYKKQQNSNVISK